MCFNEYELWTLKSQCFSSQILELVHIYHSNTCSASVVVSLFCYFSLQWKRQICSFLKMKIYHLGPFWKNENESVYLTYSICGYIVGFLGEVTQISTKSLIIFDTNNIYLIFFQKSTNVKRKKLQNQVLSFLEEICLQTNWWTDGSEEFFSWVQPVFGDPFWVNWCICITSKPFLIGNAGITQVKQHADTATHTQSHKTYSNQTPFLKPGPSAPLQLTAKDGALKAEVIEALKMVELNMSFASANDSGKSFAIQFPDSNIAENYQMEEIKAKYFIQFGVYLHLHSMLLEDLKNMPFTFLFDKTTTSQIKKQYNSYIIFYSKQERKVVTQYTGSLFVGHCKKVDLLDHFFKFMENFKVDNDFLVSNGMDGPNISKSFERKLQKKLEKDKGNSFLSWLLWITYCEHGFWECLKQLKETLEVEQLLISSSNTHQREGKTAKKWKI